MSFDGFWSEIIDMNKKIFVRLIFDALIFFFVINGWWFAALPLGAVGLWVFPFYIEIMLAGVIYDSLFGFIPDLGWLGYAGVIISSLLIFLIVMLKKRMRSL